MDMNNWMAQERHVVNRGDVTSLNTVPADHPVWDKIRAKLALGENITPEVEQVLQDYRYILEAVGAGETLYRSEVALVELLKLAYHARDNGQSEDRVSIWYPHAKAEKPTEIEFRGRRYRLVEEGKIVPLYPEQEV